MAPFLLANAAPFGLEPGKYHALIIANQHYKALPSLNTPHADAEALAKVLRRDYGFKITLLRDVDRATTLDALDLQVERLGERDNLLIFYAGHGHLDPATGEGYWLPVSANPRRRSEWISNKTINDTLRAVRARHVMVISDSCFSGTLTRNVRAGLDVARDRGAYYHKLVRQRSRTALTSGGLEPVDDGGGGGHSVFAGALLAMLESNREAVLEGEQLYQMIRRPVALNSSAQQQPAYADVRQTGHEGGDFLFIHRNPRRQGQVAPGQAVQPAVPPGQQTATDPAAFELSFWQTIKDSDDPRDFAAYLRAYPEGRFAALARLRAGKVPAAANRQPAQKSPAKPPVVARIDPAPARPLPADRPAGTGKAVVLLAYAVPDSEYSPEFRSVDAYSKAVAGLMQAGLGLA
ncbi:MAG: caspase family protein, partial [Granulosicoccaceae bacterium]